MEIKIFSRRYTFSYHHSPLISQMLITAFLLPLKPEINTLHLKCDAYYASWGLNVIKKIKCDIIYHEFVIAIKTGRLQENYKLYSFNKSHREICFYQSNKLKISSQRWFMHSAWFKCQVFTILHTSHIFWL